MTDIEKVARALCRADPEIRMGDADGVVEQRVNIEWVHYVGTAQAAIAAMQPAPQEPVGSAAEITRLTEALEAENERLRLDVETGRRLEREAIVAWLRTQDDPSEKWALQNSHWYAAEIEAGEHLK